MKNVFIIFISVILFSCQSQKKYNYVNIKQKNSKTYINGEGNIFKIDSVILLKSAKNIHLGKINKICLIDSFIIVKDKYSVYVYDCKGNFLKKIGDKGLAKNEYSYINTFYLDKSKNINLLDVNLNKILIFKLNGTFVRTITIKENPFTLVDNVEVLPNNKLFVCNGISKGINNIYQIYDIESGKINTIDQTPLKTSNDVWIPFGGHTFTVYNHKLKYIKPFDNCIYTLDNTAWRIITNKKVMTEDDLENMNKFEDNSSMMKVLNGNFFKGYTDIFETSRYLILGFSYLDYVVVDKQEKTYKIYSYDLNNNVSNYEPLFHIMTTYKDQLISVVEPFVNFNIKPCKGYNKIIKVLNGKKYLKETAIIFSSFNK